MLARTIQLGIGIGTVLGLLLPVTARGESYPFSGGYPMDPNMQMQMMQMQMMMGGGMGGGAGGGGGAQYEKHSDPTSINESGPKYSESMNQTTNKAIENMSSSTKDTLDAMSKSQPAEVSPSDAVVNSTKDLNSALSANGINSLTDKAVQDMDNIGKAMTQAVSDEGKARVTALAMHSANRPVQQPPSILQMLGGTQLGGRQGDMVSNSLSATTINQAGQTPRDSTPDRAPASHGMVDSLLPKAEGMTQSQAESAVTTFAPGTLHNPPTGFSN